ncbi:MAG: hypothetical protein DI582_06250 [Azospirillum brasilense]|nr:MAG: hypothetical protein DI582_06250 [Azospirillum brasilense]
MKKNQPKDQHILPEMFLSGFVNESRNIFMFDANKNKISDPRNVNSVAKHKHIYTVINGQNKDYTVEEKFSEIESHAAPLFKKIASAGFIDITAQDIAEIIDFIVLIFIRTPRATLIAERVMKKDEVLSKMIAIDPKAKKVADACSNSRGLSYAITLESSFLHRHKVLTDNFDLILLTAEEGSPPFILNDMFCCLEMTSLETHYIDDNIDWSKMSVKKHFPVSNKHCVSFIPKKDKSRIGTSEITYGRTFASQSDVQIINRLSFSQKERYAYCSQMGALQDAIANGGGPL